MRALKSPMRADIVQTYDLFRYSWFTCRSDLDNLWLQMLSSEIQDWKGQEHWLKIWSGLKREAMLFQNPQILAYLILSTLKTYL